MVDLRVYSLGAAALSHGGLYTFTFSDFTPYFALPFTYPPFAALIFFPLHFVPFTLLAVLWQLAGIAALWGVIRLSLRLLLNERSHQTKWRRAAILWTALALWIEPIQSTLEIGQINIFLALGILLAVSNSKWWVAGGIVGILAGIKLTPAVTGLYFLARRNTSAAAAAALVFASTVAVSFLMVGNAAHTYFSQLIGDASRIGPVSSVMNQSLRGMLSRFAGHDVGTSGVWLIAVACALTLCVLAWRGLDRDDRLGTLLIVQLFGLLVSPISWSHHWVWLVPALLWLIHGPLANIFVANITAAAWLSILLTELVWILSQQSSFWETHYSVWLAFGGAIYPIGTCVILALMASQQRLVERHLSKQTTTAN